jgi:hypothetical protein
MPSRLTLGICLLTTALAGCPKRERKVDDKRPAASQPGQPPAAPAARALPPDKDYAAGEVPGVTLALETRLDLPQLEQGPGTLPPELKQAQADSALTQTLQVDGERGRMVFTTKDSYLARGTELRHRRGEDRYVLADPAKKRYWTLSGHELANLLEGGPALTRKGYTLNIEAPSLQRRMKIAGVEVTLTRARLGFDWQVKTRAGSRGGHIDVALSIWHSADPRLQPAWADMVKDFLLLPFQDTEARPVITRLKKAVSFPVKWSMAVEDRESKQKGAKEPKMVTTTVALTVEPLGRSSLAYPPAGFAPAPGPFRIGEGAQTVAPELLSKLPARPGKPPEAVEDLNDETTR